MIQIRKFVWLPSERFMMNLFWQISHPTIPPDPFVRLHLKDSWSLGTAKIFQSFFNL